MTILLGVSVLLLLALAVTIAKLCRNTAAFQHEKTELERENSDLKKKVRKRTVQYHDANLQLRQEIIDRTVVEGRLRVRSAALEAEFNAIVITDQKGVILWVNPAFTKLSGYTKDDVKGQTPRLLKSGRNGKSFYKTLWTTILSGEVWQGEITNKRKDGCLYEEEMTITPVLDTSNRITHFVSIKRDITDRKNAENALEEAYAETEQLLASISSILIGVGPDDRITRWNKAANETFGIPAQKVIGIPFVDCGIDWDWDVALKNISHCRDHEQPTRLEDIRYVRPDGKEGFLGITINPIVRETDEHTGYVLLGVDVTERKTIEQQLAHAQKLESIGQLAAGIAHEINTPLQYVGDNTRFLQNAFDELGEVLVVNKQELESAKKVKNVPNKGAEESELDYLIDEIPSAIEQTLQGVERVTDIVRAMKEFSHPGVGEKILTNINKAIENTVTVTRNEWKYVADLVLNLDPALPLVPCLPGEINQALLNIIMNAAQAISTSRLKGDAPNGTITISTKNKEGWVEIRITDTGPGIPESIRQKIYDPFFTTKEIGNGSGQGLCICHAAIVDKHGGTLDMETAVGKGTTFIVRLPGDAISASKGVAS